MWGIVVQAFKYSAEYSSTIDPKYSLYEFFEEKVKVLYPKHDQKRQRELVLQMAELWGAFVGSSVKTQSLKFFWLEECIDGGGFCLPMWIMIANILLENLFCAGTYKKILDLIAEPALKKAHIKLLTKVNRIETDSEKVKVFTEESTVYEFDEVVMTAPLGWLKRNEQAFDPPLPPRLSQAIDAIGYGSLEKVRQI
jgi:hypothetical protein